MESYLVKFNKKLEKTNDIKKVKREKLKFQIAGGLVLGLGIAGFLASFITFMVLFFKFKTNDAFIAWEVAVPFLLMIVAGSVVSRFGDSVNIKEIESHINANNKVEEPPASEKDEPTIKEDASL